MSRALYMLVLPLYLAVLIGADGKNLPSRQKRSWMMPGTLWCGAGSAAENFTNLGVFHGVDLCCREHDHCYPQIQSFEFQYGIRNYRLHTVSHCDCDQRFRECLYAVNDTMSTLVGAMYFNILEMPCFTLTEKEQCVEWYWWGSCKRQGFHPKAEFQKPKAFNYSHNEDKHVPSPAPHEAGPPLRSPPAPHEAGPPLRSPPAPHEAGPPLRSPPAPHEAGPPLRSPIGNFKSLSSSSSMNIDKGKRLLKKLARMQTKRLLGDSEESNGGSREDHVEMERERPLTSPKTNKRSFRNRKRRIEDSHKRTTSGQNITDSVLQETIDSKEMTLTRSTKSPESSQESLTVKH